MLRPLTEEQAQFAADQIPLVHYLIRKWQSSFSGFLEYEEMISVGYEALCRAAGAYDPTRGVPFVYYAARSIRNRLISECEIKNRQTSRRSYKSIDFLAAEQKDTDELMDLHTAIEALPPKLQYAVKGYYFENDTQQALADNIGVSSTAINKRLRNAEQKIKNSMS